MRQKTNRDSIYLKILLILILSTSPNIYSQDNSSSSSNISKTNQLNDLTSSYHPIQVGNLWYYRYTSNSSQDTFYTSIKIENDTLINGKRYSILNHYFPGGYKKTRFARIDTVTNNYYEVWTIEYLADSTTCNTPGNYSWGILNIFNANILGIQSVVRSIENTSYSSAWGDSYALGLGLCAHYSYSAGHASNEVLIYSKIDGVEYGQIPVSVYESKDNIPDKYELSQNYPNPFNPITNISFNIPNKSFITLNIFDLLGRIVDTIVSEELSAGSYTRSWNGVNLPSGIYFYSLQSDNFLETKKLILLK